MHARWLALVLVCSTAYADDYVPPDFLSQTPPLPGNVDGNSAMKLDLAEALRIAVKQNLNVTLERKNANVAELGITVAGGLFEPTIDASYAQGHSRTPPTTSQEGAAGEILSFTDDRWDIGISERIQTGMVLSARWTNARSRSTLGTAVEPLTYRSALTIETRQPLLRGFSLDTTVPRLAVLQAHLASERERQQVSVVITEVVERTEAAYWDVVRALFNYDLQRRSQSRAEEQLSLTKRQIDAGVTPPSDLISAESTLAQRQLQVLQAQQSVEAAWDQLRAVMHLPREDWAKPILPVDVPKFERRDVSPEQALQTALKHRPELAQAALDLEVSALNVRKADNDKLPQIDVGLSGTVVGQDSDWGGALGQATGFDARGWNVFVNFSWTPLNRATRAAAEIERTRHDIAIAQREQLVQQIWLSVRDAVRNQQSAAEQVTAAARFRELAAKSLDVEQRKFMNGTSSNFVVAQRQEDLASAQVAELTAVLEHTKASAAVAKATGELLQLRKIELDVKR
jgi:HAE1 family hydrophobic/amphiphilic exporter-1